MELDAVDRQLSVPDAHHLALAAGGRDLEHVRNRRGCEGVVPARLELVRKTGEEAAAVVPNRARFAVHEPPRGPDLAPERLDDRLVAEADPERRDTAPPDELDDA